MMIPTPSNPPNDGESEGRASIYDRLAAIRPPDLSEAAWARRAGVSASFFQDLRTKGVTPRVDTLEKILGAVDFSLAKFDAIDGQDPPVGLTGELVDSELRLKKRPDLPEIAVFISSPCNVGELSGTIDLDQQIEAETIEFAKPIRYIARPYALADQPSAYILLVSGETMAPRYRPGDAVCISPDRPPRIGDDVLVELTSESEAPSIILLKTLKRRSALELELEQFNPAVSFTISADHIAAVHRVIPSSELLGF